MSPRRVLVLVIYIFVLVVIGKGGRDASQYPLWVRGGGQRHVQRDCVAVRPANTGLTAQSDALTSASL